MTPFGRSLLDAWMIDPGITYLNHGTVGATPRRVLDAQRRIRDEIERQPSQYLLRELSAIRVGLPTEVPGRLRMAADVVGAFLGVPGRDLVFVDNVTAGITAVLAGIQLGPGDELLLSDLAYGGIVRAAAYAARRSGAELVTVALPDLASDTAIAAAFEAAITPRTRLAIVDHVTAESALVMPVREIARVCRARGVLVAADGAHAPGAIPVDIPSLGVDFYSGNLHKWAWAPRSCGILWAPPAQQTALQPPVVSWGADSDFTTRFDWVGTRDPSPFIAAPEAIAYMTEFGISRVQEWNHRLAWQAAQFLSDRWRSPRRLSESAIGTMATVPLPERFGSTVDKAAALRDALLFEDCIEVQVHAWRGQIWLRISAQIYNDMDDITRLAAAVDRR